MTNTQQDIQGIKQKLFEHIEKTYDKEKSDTFKTNINNMNEEEFIEFLRNQGLLPGEDGQINTQCVFCKMINGEIPTTKIAENEDAIVILEINPITKGHSMVIPKVHVSAPESLSKGVGQLAEIARDELKRAFKPSRVDFIPGNVMGHEIINLLPIYSNETIDSPRSSESPEGLKKLKEQIDDSKPIMIEEATAPTIIEEEAPKTEDENAINETNTWLPKRYRNF